MAAAETAVRFLGRRPVGRGRRGLTSANPLRGPVRPPARGRERARRNPEPGCRRPRGAMPPSPRRRSRTARPPSTRTRAGPGLTSRQDRRCSPGARARVHRIPAEAGRPRHRREHVQHGSRRARADVEHSVAVRMKRAQMGLHHVGDVHVVTLVQPVAVDYRAFAEEHGATEGGHHAGPAGHAPARPVDVAVAEDRIPHASRGTHGQHIGFGRGLRGAVGRKRPRRAGLRRRPRRRIPIERAARGSQYEPPHTGGEAVLEHVHRAAHIDLGPPAGGAQGFADIRPRRQVHHRLRLRRSEESAQIGIGDIVPEERRHTVEPTHVPARTVVDHRDAVAPGREPFDQRPTDEPGPAGHQDVHPAGSSVHRRGRALSKGPVIPRASLPVPCAGSRPAVSGGQRPRAAARDRRTAWSRVSAPATSTTRSPWTSSQFLGSGIPPVPCVEGHRASVRVSRPDSVARRGGPGVGRS